MDAAQDKVVRELLARLAGQLAAGDLDGFGPTLRAEGSAAVLQAARERKLVLKAAAADRRSAAQAMADHAANRLDADEAGRFARHLQIVVLVSERAAAVQEALDRALARLPAMRQPDLISLAQGAFDEAAGAFVEPGRDWYDPTRPVGTVEREWQDLNGRIFDVTAAVCRAVNEAARRVDSRRALRPDARPAARAALRRSVMIASMLNGLEWIRDSVALGDLDVTSLDQRDDAGPVVTLEFRDRRRSLLRTLCARREMMMEAFGTRPSRVVRLWLEGDRDAAIHNALERHLTAAGGAADVQGAIDETSRAADTFANGIDFEDDMLMTAGEADTRVLGRYLLASMLRWDAAAAVAVARRLPKSVTRRLPPAAIPLDRLMEEVAEPSFGAVAEQAWLEETVLLPAPSHWDLMRSPFVRGGDGRTARPLLHGASGSWNAAIRERLLRGGAIGKAIGARWEEYYADRFREAGWTVVGRGVKLRRQGRTLTDLDLLLMRDDLLIVAQVKALGGAAMSPYDHWRARKVVEKGYLQARIAHDGLADDRTLIQAVAGRRAMERVGTIQPVVLTNLGALDGWEHEGVPVLGATGVKAITTGSRVDYVDPKHDRVFLTRHFTRPEELDTATILKALRSPIEIAIAPETGETSHADHAVAGMTFRLPEFAVAAERAGPVMAATDRAAAILAARR